MIKLEIKWTVSKSQNTYGYNVCMVNGYNGQQLIKASCNGGGYDMLSTSIADAIMQIYPEKFSKEAGYTDQQIKDNYGMIKRDDGSYYIDGGCGTVERVTRDLLGLKVSYAYSYNRKGQAKDRIAVIIEEM